MDIRKTSPNTVKVSLSHEELLELDVTYESLDYICPKTRRAIEQILEAAIAETGFSPEGKRLLIEASPLPEDGCCLSFSLLEEFTEHKNSSPHHPVTDTCYFCFDEFDTLCTACGKLYKMYSHRIFQSSLYQFRGNYILVIQSLDGPESNIRLLLSEFGQEIPSCDFLLPYVQEHSAVILAKNAVDQISQLFL